MLATCIVYDVFNRESFEHVGAWLEDMRLRRQYSSDNLYYLLANKSVFKRKLRHQQKVSKEEAENWVKEQNLKMNKDEQQIRFFEVNAENDINLKPVFD